MHDMKCMKPRHPSLKRKRRSKYTLIVGEVILDWKGSRKRVLGDTPAAMYVFEKGAYFERYMGVEVISYSRTSIRAMR